MSILQDVKDVLELPDDSKDNQLTGFINRISKRLRVRLNFPPTVPDELDYIVVECAIKRFRQKGDEGMSSYSQEGESIHYDSLLDEYEQEILAWNEKQSGRKKRGRIRFL